MARKRNTESEPVRSAGTPAASSGARASRTAPAARPRPASRKAVAAEPEPKRESVPASVVAAPKGLTESISNLSAAVKPESIREEIAKLAYLYWEERGGQGGSPEEDWLRAERELLGHNAAAAVNGR